jgi:hypothetical protein
MSSLTCTSIADSNWRFSFPEYYSYTVTYCPSSRWEKGSYPGCHLLSSLLMLLIVHFGEYVIFARFEPNGMVVPHCSRVWRPSGIDVSPELRGGCDKMVRGNTSDRTCSFFFFFSATTLNENEASPGRLTVFLSDLPIEQMSLQAKDSP